MYSLLLTTVVSPYNRLDYQYELTHQLRFLLTTRMIRNRAEVSRRLNNEVGSVLNHGKHVPKRKQCSRWRKHGKKIGTEAEAGKRKRKLIEKRWKGAGGLWSAREK